MKAIEYTARARADLADIIDYGYEIFGQAAAEDYLRGLDRTMSLIAEYPHAGAVYAGVQPSIRSISSGSQRIFYDVTRKGVRIRRVLHKAMDVARHL